MKKVARELGGGLGGESCGFAAWGGGSVCRQRARTQEEGPGPEEGWLQKGRVPPQSAAGSSRNWLMYNLW